MNAAQARDAPAHFAQAAPDLAAAASSWLNRLKNEKRGSPHTLAAYARDAEAFVTFLAEHIGGEPDLAALKKLRPADFRAWLTRRAMSNFERSSTARALSALRSLFVHLDRAGVDLPVRTEVAVELPARPSTVDDLDRPDLDDAVAEFRLEARGFRVEDDLAHWK